MSTDVYIPPLPYLDSSGDQYNYVQDYWFTVRGVCLDKIQYTDTYRLKYQEEVKGLLKKLNNKKHNKDNKIFYYSESSPDTDFHECCYEPKDLKRYFELGDDYPNIVPVLYSMVETRFRIERYIDISVVKFTGTNKDLCMAINKFGPSLYESYVD